MKTRLIATIAIVLITITGQANPNLRESLRRMRTIHVTAFDTLNGYEKQYRIPDEDLNDLFAIKLDSMVNSWYIQNAFILDSIEIASAETLHEVLPDSVYIERLQAIESVIDLSFNNTVKNFIAMYTIRKRNLVEIMLGLSQYYFPMFEEALDRHNMPMELKYMAIIESALNPVARSSANAVGLWQFMFATGRMYKLEIGTFVDERRDPLKSTEAAVSYLKDLYNMYNNWHLVIAAYNCGPGNVNKAIRRAGGARDYWSIYYHLPRETRGYVPAFIAAAYVMEHYKHHNLKPRTPDFPIVTDTLMVHEYIHFNQISDMLGISVEELRSLNPQYRIDIIPAKEDKPYSLTLPISYISSFIDNEDLILAYDRDKYFPNNEILTPKTHTHHTPGDIQGKDRVHYTVKSGDNPGYIANWFNVRLNDLRYWNNIQRNMIRVGQRLVIYVPQGTGPQYERINQMSFAEKQRGIKISAPAATSQSGQKETTEGGYIYYTVQKGDNLWSIARKYPGVSNNDIMRLNNLRSDSNIQPGQRLRIRPTT